MDKGRSQYEGAGTGPIAARSLAKPGLGFRCPPVEGAGHGDDPWQNYPSISSAGRGGGDNRSHLCLRQPRHASAERGRAIRSRHDNDGNPCKCLAPLPPASHLWILAVSQASPLSPSLVVGSELCREHEARASTRAEARSWQRGCCATPHHCEAKSGRSFGKGPNLAVIF